MFNQIKDLCLEAFKIERTFRLGRVNLRWTLLGFFAWLALLVANKIQAISIIVLRDAKDRIAGLSLTMGGANSLILLFWVFIFGIVCISLLTYLSRKGFIEKDDF